MSRKLTITVDDDVYEGLHHVIGRRRISRFLNDLARPHVMARDLVEGYRAMAADEEREREAEEWVENLAGDVASDQAQLAGFGLIGQLEAVRPDAHLVVHSAHASHDRLAQAARLDVVSHKVQGPRHVAHVGAGAAHGGETGQLRFQRLSRLEDGRQPVPPGHELHEVAAVAGL